ncbi:MAG: hypothetical protein AB7I08_12300 [Thermoleophilia bacterium]
MSGVPATGLPALDALIASPALPADGNEVYATVLRGLVEGTAARPGFGALHILLCERLAYSYARARALQNLPSGYGPDIDRANRQVLEFARTLIAEGKLADATDAARQQIVREVARTVLNAIDESPALTEGQRLDLKLALRDQFDSQLDSLDAARRVLGGLPFDEPPRA